jgi:secondary thiamine-phosphate synthase enzyme
MLKTITLQTEAGESLVNINEELRVAVKESGVKEGICVVYVPHTTAALTVNSGIDPKTAMDIVDEVHRLVPTRVDFHHTYDTPADASGHVKASLVGGDVTLIITEGELLLGGSQSVLFFEFDGPRSRKVVVRIMADS